MRAPTASGIIGTPSDANRALSWGVTIPPSQGPHPNDFTSISGRRRDSAHATFARTSFAMA